jgi:uncharacterized membrane protein
MIGVKFFEHSKRSIVKTLTYRFVIVISTLLITYSLTHEIQLTLGIVFAANLTNTILYFIHERIWNRIHWGKTK